MTERRVPRTFTSEFKRQILQLYENGKPRVDLIREYEIIKLRKENQRLQMENDI